MGRSFIPLSRAIPRRCSGQSPRAARADIDANADPLTVTVTETVNETLEERTVPVMDERTANHIQVRPTDASRKGLCRETTDALGISTHVRRAMLNTERMPKDASNALRAALFHRSEEMEPPVLHRHERYGLARQTYPLGLSFILSISLGRPGGYARADDGASCRETSRVKQVQIRDTQRQ